MVVWRRGGRDQADRAEVKSNTLSRSLKQGWKVVTVTNKPEGTSPLSYDTKEGDWRQQSDREIKEKHATSLSLMPRHGWTVKCLQMGQEISILGLRTSGFLTAGHGHQLVLINEVLPF